VLVHGKEIVEATPLPIGLTSEEGAESNTKFARRFHENHTRKTSQEDTMSDLFHRMMDISDPVVVAMSPQTKTMPEKHLPPDMAEHQNLTHLKTVQNKKMTFPLLTNKKKTLLISMYQYAMMLTCHLTQNNVNQLMTFLCTAYGVLKIFNENSYEN
jgi:hypothetical protein